MDIPVMGTPNTGEKVQSEDQARNAILEHVRGVEEAREACNAGGLTVSPRDQRKAYHQYTSKYLFAIAGVYWLHRAGLLSDIAYMQLRQRVLETLRPTVIDGSMAGADLAGLGRKR